MARHRARRLGPGEPSLKKRIDFRVEDMAREMLMANPAVKQLESKIKRNLMAAAMKASHVAVKSPVKKKIKR